MRPQPSGQPDLRTDYVERILALHNSGATNAHQVYTEVYGSSHEQAEDEADIDYIRRCSEQDYYDGSSGAAVYQAIYDGLSTATNTEPDLS